MIELSLQINDLAMFKSQNEIKKEEFEKLIAYHKQAFRDQTSKLDETVKKAADLTRKVDELTLRENRLRNRLDEQEEELNEAKVRLKKAERQLSSSVSQDQPQKSEACKPELQKRFVFADSKHTVNTSPTAMTEELERASPQPLVIRPPVTVPQSLTNLQTNRSPQAPNLVSSSVEALSTEKTSSAPAFEEDQPI